MGWTRIERVSTGVCAFARVSAKARASPFDQRGCRGRGGGRGGMRRRRGVVRSATTESRHRDFEAKTRTVIPRVFRHARTLELAAPSPRA